ncbi:glycosyltransferase [Acaryochloris marina NIES-2412]|uniref:glycosyltransferase n=1 Tax=Acaryochloris marina TaxID=155978 RepID=UPI004059DE1B
MEGFGVVILEANKARTSVVASNLEGLRDMVQDSCNGFKVAPLNAHPFAQAIDDVLERKLPGLSDAA